MSTTSQNESCAGMPASTRPPATRRRRMPHPRHTLHCHRDVNTSGECASAKQISLLSLIHALMVIAIGVGCAGCAAMLAPARSSGIALSEEGIQLAVVGQVCKQSRSTSASSPPLLDATLAIEVGNPTPGLVSVYPDRLILVAPGGVSARASTPQGSNPLSVESGTTVPVRLHFTLAGANCSQEMQLDASSALESQGRPVTVSAIRFLPVAPR